MRFEDDEVVFDSGRREYCHAATIGIDEDLDPTYGYDGSFGAPFESPFAFTKEERAELANHMIALWTRYRDKE